MTETNTLVHPGNVGPDLPYSGSDGHSSWKDRDSDFSVKFVKLLFDASGNSVGEADLVEAIELSGDRFTGAFTIQFNFLDNSPSLCSGGTLKAQRIVAP